MSTGPDDPTRPVPPQQPREPYVRERVVEQDPWREELLDRVNSLRTALVLVGVLAAIALGVAAYALIDANTEDDGGTNGRTAASAEKVSDLEQQVEELDSRVDDRATKNQVSELNSDVEDLQDQVRQLSQQDSGGGDEEAQQANEQLQKDLQQLEDRVNDLEQQQSQGGGETP